jgi:hypothetical protein
MFRSDDVANPRPSAVAEQCKIFEKCLDTKGTRVETSIFSLGNVG